MDAKSLAGVLGKRYGGMEEGAREQYLWETDRGKGRRQAGTRIRVRIDTHRKAIIWRLSSHHEYTEWIK